MTDSRGCEHEGTKVVTASNRLNGVADPEGATLPFGPKRAPSYFQEMMASIVLLGLIYQICEEYLDDIIVYGNGFNQFCERLEILFQHFSFSHLSHICFGTHCS